MTAKATLTFAVKCPGKDPYTKDFVVTTPGNHSTQVFKIGRDQKCQISFPEVDSIFRMHAVLEVRGGTQPPMVEVIDLGGGIKLNTFPVNKTVVKIGDILEVGDISLQLEEVRHLVLPEEKPAQDSTPSASTTPVRGPTATKFVVNPSEKDSSVGRMGVLRDKVEHTLARLIRAALKLESEDRRRHGA